LEKTKETKKYELETIKDTIEKYTEQIKKVKEEVKTATESLKTEQGKLESMKTSSITAKLKGEDKTKSEVEISAVVSKITDLEA
jgi:predicted  nucleic acid-binding Zn-ribbon protein